MRRCSVKGFLEMLKYLLRDWPLRAIFKYCLLFKLKDKNFELGANIKGRVKDNKAVNKISPGRVQNK